MPEGKSMLDPVKPEDSYSAKTHLHQPVPEMATVAATALPADAPEAALPSEVRPEIITWEKLVEAIHASGLELTGNMEQILTGAVQTVENNKLYTPRAFEDGNSARKVLEYSMSDLASADRAAVEEQIAAGVSAAEAEALYLTDEYFENWYQSLCTELSAYEG